jgi:hypothetical protein
MDATRSRRSRDDARQRWYARWRALRFARHLGFVQTEHAGQPLGPPGAMAACPAPGRLSGAVAAA